MFYNRARMFHLLWASIHFFSFSLVQNSGSNCWQSLKKHICFFKLFTSTFNLIAIYWINLCTDPTRYICSCQIVPFPSLNHSIPHSFPALSLHLRTHKTYFGEEGTQNPEESKSSHVRNNSTSGKSTFKLSSNIQSKANVSTSSHIFFRNLLFIAYRLHPCCLDNNPATALRGIV